MIAGGSNQPASFSGGGIPPPAVWDVAADAMSSVFIQGIRCTLRQFVSEGFVGAANARLVRRLVSFGFEMDFWSSAKVLGRL
jgi:hypothetical protein